MRHYSACTDKKGIETYYDFKKGNYGGIKTFLGDHDWKQTFQDTDGHTKCYIFLAVVNSAVQRLSVIITFRHGAHSNKNNVCLLLSHSGMAPIQTFRHGAHSNIQAWRPFKHSGMAPIQTKTTFVCYYHIQAWRPFKHSGMAPIQTFRHGAHSNKKF